MSDARGFYDPEPGSSSGATHVPSQPSTIPSSKNLASSSRGFRPDFTRNTTVPEREMRREPQNSSIPVPRFQRVAGMLHHTGGTYSHNGMVDYPRFPISEIHLGKFPDSLEFQSWKVNFKTEVCSKTKDLHLTMHWTIEVEIAKSTDELMTSRSIVGRTDFPDFPVLDAMIGSALKKLLGKHVHFRNNKCRRAACSEV